MVKIPFLPYSVKFSRVAKSLWNLARLGSATNIFKLLFLMHLMTIMWRAGENRSSDSKYSRSRNTLTKDALKFKISLQYILLFNGTIRRDKHKLSKTAFFRDLQDLA